MTDVAQPQPAANARTVPEPGSTVPILHHVNLKTTRKDAMIEWYRTVLEMEVLFDHPAAAWMSNDTANHRIALMQLPGLAPDEQRRFHDGLHHMAYEYGSFDALNATYLRLREAGIEPQVCMDHGMTLSYYYADPDGNLLELQVDVFGDWDQSSDWMRNRLAEAEFLVGASVDPARIAEAYADGMTLEEIHEKAYAGGFSPGTPPDLSVPPPPEGMPPLIRV